MGVYVPTEEEYMEAIEIWSKHNPNKTVQDINYLTKPIKISNGHEIVLANKFSNMRRGKNLLGPENMKILKEKYGFIQEKKINRNTDEEYYNGIMKYIEENDIKSVYDIPEDAEVILDNGSKVNNLGRKIIDMSRGDRLLDNKYMKILKEKTDFVIDTSKKRQTFEEYIEALDIYLNSDVNNNINTIPQKTVVKISNGSIVNIGTKISEMRNGYYLFPKKEQMDILVKKYGFKTYSELKDEESQNWVRVIYKWLELNPNKTINDIVNEEPKLILDGVEYNIGSKIRNLRENKSLLEPKYMNILINELGFLTSKGKKEKLNEDWLKAIDEWLKLNPNITINTTPKEGKFIIVDNKKYNVCTKLYKMRRHKSLLDPEYMQILRDKYGFKFLEELENEKGFIRKIEPLKKETNKEIVKEKPYEKYLEEFDGNIEKAKEKYNRIKEIEKKIRENKRNKKKEEISLDEVLKHFNVDIDELNKYLNQILERENISSPIMYEDGETLRNYCIRNGFNYSVIYNLYNTSSNRSLNELIDYYRKNVQKLHTRKVYTKDEVLTKHMLLHLGLDSEIIIRDIEKYDYTLTEAIRNDVFRKNIIKKEDKWLEQLYDDLTDSVDSNKTEEEIHNDLILVMSNALVKLKGLLKSDEYQKVLEVFTKYIKTLRNYCKLEIGLEKDRIRRKQLIKDYNLDEEEITEGTLMGLDFINGIKITDKSVESKRLETIKPLIINWNKLDKKQKEKMIKNYNLSQEEIDKIIEYNNKLVFNLRID